MLMKLCGAIPYNFVNVVQTDEVLGNVKEQALVLFSADIHERHFDVLEVVVQRVLVPARHGRHPAPVAIAQSKIVRKDS